MHHLTWIVSRSLNCLSISVTYLQSYMNPPVASPLTQLSPWQRPTRSDLSGSWPLLTRFSCSLQSAHLLAALQTCQLVYLFMACLLCHFSCLECLLLGFHINYSLISLHVSSQISVLSEQSSSLAILYKTASPDTFYPSLLSIPVHISFPVSHYSQISFLKCLPFLTIRFSTKLTVKNVLIVSQNFSFQLDNPFMLRSQRDKKQ